MPDDKHCNHITSTVALLKLFFAITELLLPTISSMDILFSEKAPEV